MTRSRRRWGIAVTMTAVAALALGSGQGAAGTSAWNPHRDLPDVRHWHEIVDAQGKFSRAPAVPTRSRRGRRPRAAGAATVTTLQQGGPVGNRLNLVIMGDGYTADELPAFDASAQKAWDALTAHEPFRTYARYFNVYRVDVPSPVSGVSYDGTATAKQTPLGMGFWCDGIERLLCADTGAVMRYAGLAPGADQVIAIANSASYGGAGAVGGPLTTTTGGNPQSDDILVHEMGHALGSLGDEYDDASGPCPGTEPAYPNVTTLPEDAMRRGGLKWTRWLGAPSPDGGAVGSYQGADGCATGYYRPSQNSVMRSLGGEFNAPSAEALIEHIYDRVSPIDSATQDPRGYLLASDQVSVAVPQTAGAPLDVTWTLNGSALAAESGRVSVALADHASEIPRGQWSTLAVTVRDSTSQVRDEGFRADRMSNTTRWAVWGG